MRQPNAEIVGRTRGHLRIAIDGRVASIGGESFLRGGHGSPDMELYSNWVDWEDGGPVSAEDHAMILESALRVARERGLRFEVV